MTVTDKEAYESRIDRVLISEEEIKQALKRCGEQISREYEGKPLLLVSVLKGAFVFLADLCREISIPCEIGFMAAQSYFEGTSSRGNVQISPRINRKSNSCRPSRNFTTTALFSDSGSFESPKPMAKANRSSESTFPSRKGLTILLGITEMMWSA